MYKWDRIYLAFRANICDSNKLFPLLVFRRMEDGIICKSDTF